MSLGLLSVDKSKFLMGKINRNSFGSSAPPSLETSELHFSFANSSK